MPLKASPSAPTDARPAAVVLVVPPFRPVALPALGVSQLKANLIEEGLTAEVLYLNLRLADRISVLLHEFLAGDVELHAGEFLFSCVRFGKGRAEIERYLEEILVPSSVGRVLEAVASRRKLVAAAESLVADAAALCAEAADEILARRPALVGFSSSFQENLASLAIARLLKARDPNVRTILGGANAQGEMGRELLARFEELDFVGQGECDHTLVELAREVCDARPAVPIAGLVRRGSAAPPPPTPVTAESLDAAPLPDFADYFSAWRKMKRRSAVLPRLALEASRGCRWGERKPCTFCGLSGESFSCRTKSVRRVRRELDSMVAQHGVHDVHMMDLMLDHALARELCPAAGERPIASCFWETGGALSRELVECLARAGVRDIQPGIEALADHTLRLLNKPTNRLANLKTLKWCRELGIRTWWSYLCGMPGESDAELAGLEELMRAVHHLTPPGEAHLVRVQRFSRYFEASDDLGFGSCRPARFYHHLYPFAEDVLHNLAYHFESERTASYASSPVYRRRREMVRGWRHAHGRSRLELVVGRRGEWVLDTRRGARRRLRRLSPLESAVLRECDAGVGVEALCRALEGRAPSVAVQAVLERLVRDRLILALDGRYLAIVLRPVTPPRLPWPRAGWRRRPPSEVAALVRRLRVGPLGALRFAVANLPAVLASGRARLSAVVWNAFARGVRLGLGASRPV